MEGNTRARPGISWSRVLTEMVVIVASILMAFSIDAWWARGEELRSLHDHEDLVGAQLSRVSIQLRDEAESAREAQESLAAAIRIISPNPEMISADSLFSLIRGGWGMSDDDIAIAALEKLIALESFEPTARPELYRQMVDFRSLTGLFGRNVDRFVSAKERTAAYLMTVAPRPTLMFEDPDPGSRFPVPVGELLRSRELEGHLRDMYERQSVRFRRSEALAALADSITASLRSGDRQ